MPEFSRLLANLLKARFPYLYVTTWEEERALEAIQVVAADESLVKTRRKIYVWSQTRGLVSEGQPGREESRAPLRALELVEKTDEPAVFVFKDFHIYFGGHGRQADPLVVRKVRDLAPLLKQADRPKSVIFLAPALVLPDDLQKDVTVIDFELPSFAEINALLSDMIEVHRNSGRFKVDLKPGDQERLVKAAQGLTLLEAENAFARAMVEDGRLDVRDVAIILEEKRQIIKKSESLEFVQTDLAMQDVGGLENLKRWLRKRDKSWLEAAQRYALPAPRGILITGIPGCGKSLVAKAISATWQLPLLRLDVGKIFSGLVGSSEENIRRSIKTAEALAPAILWIDEIEKGFSSTRSFGDSGTASRVFATFLTWMQEKTRPVFVVATANDIEALPPEFLRKGRFDEIFFVDLPTYRERVEIFRVHLCKRLTNPVVLGSLKLDNRVFEGMADLTEGFIGAEIEQVVVAGLFEAFAEERAVRAEDFSKAVRNTVPLSVTQAEQIQRIRAWASLRAVAATAQEDRAGYLEALEPAQPPEAAAPGLHKDVKGARGGRMIDI